MGVLKVLSNQASVFTESDVITLKTMARLIGAALAHQMAHNETKQLLVKRTETLKSLKKAQEKWSYLANYDVLTSLPNRNLLMERLKIALAKSARYKLAALFYLDIDHFKSINDTYGHLIGDELLKAFALRIKQAIRESDIASRLGGDEFVILLESIPNKDTAENVAKKIIALVNKPFMLNTQVLNITTSIGITFFKNNSLTVDELLSQADSALYAAKASGRNNFKIFELISEVNPT